MVLRETCHLAATIGTAMSKGFFDLLPLGCREGIASDALFLGFSALVGDITLCPMALGIGPFLEPYFFAIGFSIGAFLCLNLLAMGVTKLLCRKVYLFAIGPIILFGV